MSELQTVVVIDQTNAQQILVEESFNRPVLVDFWADWCEPCKQLMPLLEKLADEYAGAFLLAKINADEQQGIAGQLGVRSLPTVMLFKDGQPVDGFTGAQPETAIRELLQKYLPSPWDAKIAEATELLDQGQTAEAVALLRSAWEESNRLLEVTLAYAGALLEANRLDDAEAVLNEVRLVDRDAVHEQLMAQIELKREAGKSPEVEALEADLEANPDSHDVRVKLAVQLTAGGQYREALEHLLHVLRIDRDWNNGEAKRLYLDTIASIGKGDPLAAEYQRKLFSILY
ncbi:MAG: thioredoxin [Halieaceae bacterium MED-G27]|jgi:putative thioredoxin|nr:thioredoxin [Halieaceae bacterium]OUT66203.1 MAG: thioredoxin [Cellvibrionales bacterium TMED21]PDH36342.1 MAG: thioredoxin [Halieaceae bacterium MED-G27]|tara:strand:+ start:12748 stop:13608 length:861 start_codon:yes stop_codon:yes gene_type:complete